MPELAELLRDHVDGAAPPITLDEVECRAADGGASSPPVTWRRWAVAALVLAVLAVAAVALLATTGAGDAQDLDVIGPPDEGVSASAPTGDLVVAVRRPEGTVEPGEDVVLLRVGDGDGQQVGDVLVAPPGEVYDPAAGPGSVGRDVTTLVEAPGLPFGEYELTLWVHPCDGPCPTGGDDLPSEPADDEVACTGPVTVDVLEAQITAVLGADACEHLGEPTQAHYDAGDVKLRHQQEAGWVPSSLEPASPDFPRGDGWVPTKPVPCELPVPIEGYSFRCVFDVPDGRVIGVHVNGVGFVPLDELATFDLVEGERLRDERIREALEGELAAVRRQLESPDLNPVVRVELERRADELAAMVAELVQRNAHGG